MKKFLLILIFFTSFLSLFFSCDNTTEPPPPPPDKDKPTIITSIEDVSCTEVWLKLKITELHDTVEVAITRDDTIIINFKANNDIDTTLYDENLLPNKTYKYKAMISIMEDSVTSNEINAITMDTTSHNFTWQTYTFGEAIGYNSVLYDVAIVNENCIWAVGEIYMNDSLGNPDPNRYNLAKWDGSVWSIIRIPYYYQGEPFYHPIQSVFAFGPNDIWFCGNGVIHWDGKNFIPISIPTNVWGPYQMNKIWGTSSNDLYIVGNGGNIAHYQNGVWRKIESGTDVDLLDVWGSPDGTIVWACGETIYKTVLIKIENNIGKIVFEGTYPMQITKDKFSDGLLSLWTDRNNFIYILSPYNLYRCEKTTTGEGKELYPYKDYFKGGYRRLRGTGVNDLITIGNKSAITHFNGFSWKIYEEMINENKHLIGLDVIKNLVVAVGEKYENIFYYKAIITVGKK